MVAREHPRGREAVQRALTRERPSAHRVSGHSPSAARRTAEECGVHVCGFAARAAATAAPPRRGLPRRGRCLDVATGPSTAVRGPRGRRGAVPRGFQPRPTCRGARRPRPRNPRPLLRAGERAKIDRAARGTEVVEQPVHASRPTPTRVQGRRQRRPGSAREVRFRRRGEVRAHASRSALTSSTRSVSGEREELAHH